MRSRVPFAMHVGLVPLLFIAGTAPSRAAGQESVLHALELNGANSSVTVTHHPDLNLQGPFTLEAWVLAFDYQYPGHQSDPWPVNSIIDKREDSGFGRGYGLHLSNGLPAVMVATSQDSDEHAVGPTPLEMNRYYHIAGTWDGDSLRIFLDGVPQAATHVPSTYVVGSGELVMGSRYSHNEYWWDGLFAEVRVSSTCRYVQTFTPPHTLLPDQNTVALWLFDDETGSLVVDRSGNGHDGTAQNGLYVHSIQPIILDPRDDLFSMAAGWNPQPRTPWSVRLLPNRAYELCMQGAMVVDPGSGRELESLMLYAKSDSDESVETFATTYCGLLPWVSADTLDIAIFGLDWNSTDNTGQIRANFSVADPAHAPSAPSSPPAASRSAVFVSPNPSTEMVTFARRGPDVDGAWDIRIIDVSGRLIRQLHCTGNSATWDLRDEKGRQVSNGVYAALHLMSGGLSSTRVVVRR